MNPLWFVDPYGLCAESPWYKKAAGFAADVLDFLLPDARILNISGNAGAIFSGGMGGQLVENYRSGEVSLFGFVDVAGGWQAGDLSYSSGFVWDLPNNENYSGGFLSLEGGAWILGGSLFVGGNSGIGPDGGAPSINWSGPKGIAVGPSLSIPGVKGVLAEYSDPIDLRTVPPGMISSFLDADSGIGSSLLSAGHKLRTLLENISK